MDEEGDNSGGQQKSAPESSHEINPPLHLSADQPSLLWHHDHDQTSNYQDFLNMLSNVELVSPAPPPPSIMMLPSKIESVGGGFEKGESSGTKRTSDVVQVQVPHTQSEVITQEVEREDQQRPPRTRRGRSAQVHNLSERTRRGRITQKIRTLQGLIPNCNKTDKASVLADAIEYIKFLQQQVQMKSTYQSMLVPYYSSAYPMRPMMGLGYGMGMYGSPYATSLPMTPIQQGLNPFGEPGLILQPPPSQVQFPAVHLTVTTMSTGPTTATPSTSVTSLSSTFSQGESSSAQSIQRIDPDLSIKKKI